jgi:hypothetical protein
LRLAFDGMAYSKEAKVVPMRTGAPKETPPLVDLTTFSRRLPVSGKKPKTSPLALVLTSSPIAVPVVSAPLTWIGACHEPPGPVRRAMKAGLPLCQIA